MRGLLADLWVVILSRFMAWLRGDDCPAGQTSRLRGPLACLVRRALLAGLFIGVAVALTWPALPEGGAVVLGGGELGGWVWRQWWHFQEIAALGQSDLSWPAHAMALIGLGRHPETGNVLDLLMLSWPLDHWFGFPWHHNLKVLTILAGNGLCGFVLARSLSGSAAVGAAAGLVAMVNPLVFQDVNKTGLRQVLLWWMLLYPVALSRAQDSGKARDGAVAGLLFVLVAAFYWFYGLFIAMYTAIVLPWRWLAQRPARRHVLGWALPAALVAVVGCIIFVAPYLTTGEGSGGQGGVTRLPELSFFLPFPAYDTVASAPLRPSLYRDNVLSSLHRTIDSGWPVDMIWNPGHGTKAFPMVVLFCAVLPALWIRSVRRGLGGPWLVTWVIFWLGSLGPYLKIGAQRDTTEVVHWGEHVIRLPYTWMFQWVPGMSRMFAPYRMGSMVVVASVALAALVLARFEGRRRVVACVFFGLAVVLQPFYRFDLGPVAEGAAGPAMWRIPTQVSAMRVPDFYAQLGDEDVQEGIIELPLGQQQDLICLYQVTHQRKLYRSWATPPALPPDIRESGGGEVGARLRWLAKQDPRPGPVDGWLQQLSDAPLEVDPEGLDVEALLALAETGPYRYLVVHERGYFLSNPDQGGVLYRHVVRVLSERLGQEATELTEQESFDWPGKSRHFPVGPAWIPWASQEVSLPAERMPTRYAMAVFELAP